MYENAINREHNSTNIFKCYQACDEVSIYSNFNWSALFVFVYSFYLSIKFVRYAFKFVCMQASKLETVCFVDSLTLLVAREKQ